MPDMDRSIMDLGNLGIDHRSVPTDKNSAPTDTPSPGHPHHMTPSMLLVEREHFWFMIVGIGVALFKLISDGESWHRRRFIPYVWPSGMVLLGVLLVLYRE